MRILANLLVLAVAGLACADLTGQWQGIATLGPSSVAQGMDGDSLIKLQMSKAFLKSLNYTFQFKPDKSFASLVTGEDVPRRSGKGTWVNTGNLVIINFTEENGNKRIQTLNGTLSPDGKKLLITINGKPGLPPTKLVFKKVESAGTKPPAPTKPATKSHAAKSTGH